MNRTVLFICTGNYYRSRFAEILFNWLSQKAHLGWQAASRGAALEFGGGNIGPISSHTLQALAARGISTEANIRYPIRLEERDLLSADRIVGLNEIEHRPLLQKRFPEWANRVEYWHVPDLDRVGPEVALYAIERQVRRLIAELERAPKPRSARKAGPQTGWKTME